MGVVRKGGCQIKRMDVAELRECADLFLWVGDVWVLLFGGSDMDRINGLRLFGVT